MKSASGVTKKHLIWSHWRRRSLLPDCLTNTKSRSDVKTHPSRKMARLQETESKWFCSCQRSCVLKGSWLKQNLVITVVRVSSEINIKPAHVFSFGLFVFSEAPVRFWKEHRGSLERLAEFLSWCDAWRTRGPLFWALTAWLKRSSAN